MKSLRHLLFSLAVMLLSATATAGEFTLATYNIRQANASDSAAGNGWGRRLPHVASICRLHGFDIFGTQEGFAHQLDSLQKQLPGYSRIGVGRDDGIAEGEHSAIFYRDDMFELLDHGDFWLAPDPTRPALGWDAACVRICTWGKFRVRDTGFSFVYLNLHMDHVGRTARAESAKLVLAKIGEIAGGLPAVVSGDFNVDQHSESYRLLDNSGVVRDSYATAEWRYAPNGTFNAYHTDGYTPSRIDHIFVSPHLRVMTYGVITSTYPDPDAVATLDDSAPQDNFPDEVEQGHAPARLPSDHFPVAVRLRY